MGFAHLVNSEDVHIKYCLEGDIENDRRPRLIFFPLMVVLKGGVKFPLDPFLLKTLNFYRLSPD